MKRSLLLALTLLGLAASCTEPAKDRNASVDRELNALLDLLPGSYSGEAPKAMQPDGAMQSLVHSFQPVDTPELGERVLYYHVTRDTRDGPILQAKLFVFDTAADRTANTMHALVLDPAQAKALRGADAAQWQAMSPQELMSFPEDCFFTWEPVEEGFHGEGSDTCSYESKAFEQTITPDMRYRISSDEFALEETLLGEDGSIIVTTGGMLVANRQ